MPGIYISYPFCGQKCTFCNFASGVFPRELERCYVAALLDEIARWPRPWRPRTVYLGGGTPSRMDPGDLARVLAAVGGAPWLEATIECAPGALTEDLARHWRECGITRVSLGVQSFVPLELACTGRRHTPVTVAAEIEMLRRAGLARCSIDLIAGLPHQTAESWRESLGWIRRLDPGHVSVYMLEIDDDSRLGREIHLHGPRYGAPAVPGEDLTTELYETAAAELAAMGYRRYEISNFARPGQESAHNLKYWRLEPYAGFGADAHSSDGRLRWSNVESPAEYVDRMEHGQSPVFETTPARPEEERFFVGLRLMEGVRPTAEEWRRFAAPIDRFVAAGLLEREGGIIRLTAHGILLSNEVFQEFLCP
jgi:oxygen-independent coproporphyrinogen III oxidase